MSLVVEIRPAGEYLHALVTGPGSYKDACDAYAQIVAAAHQHRRLKILADMRVVEPFLSIRERIEFGAFGSQLRLQALADGQSSAYRIAFIVPSAPGIDAKAIGLTEARRRGWDDLVGIFEREEEALAWLGVEPEPPPSPALGDSGRR